ncbi:hypothetical protein KUTeg_000833 [Tegillarca granosa]|uniref:G-protein coupled receptors family 1 profile domain-containing protein n=1 Tax=Tegillarca granosa TaxID=220873 RepID=A0ABQ9G224_TEGGR|nr:hypothetical protein KUTeg_000833 [Tegillarca granosa]
MYFNNSGLLEVREDIQLTLFPAVILIVIYMIFGIFGNILVIIYYGFIQKQNPSFLFIVSMAASDLTACTFSMPLEIVDIMEFYTFPSVAACKLLRFVNYFVSCSSSLFLLWIAVDRYKKFCKPFNTQMSVKNAKIILASSVLAALCVTCPNVIFYDVVPVNVTNTYDTLPWNENTSGTDDVIGYDCKTKENYRLLVTGYHGSLFLLFLVIIFSLVILYFHVIRKMLTMDHFRKENNVTIHTISKFGHNESRECVIERSKSCRKDKFMNKFRCNKKKSDKYHVATNKKVKGAILTEKENNSSDHSEQNEDETVEKGTKRNEQDNISNDQSYHTDVEPNDKETRYANSRKLSEVDDNHRNENHHVLSKTKHHENHVYTKRFTKITLSVTIAFVVSFLPYLGLMVWQTLSTDYKRLTGSGLLIYNISIRSWMLNSVVNPIIYGFLNRHFRQYVLSFFKKRACFIKCRRRV